jgi:hypothetical protein
VNATADSAGKGGGLYTGMLDLEQNGDALIGSLAAWYVQGQEGNLAVGTMFTGSLNGSNVVLNRTDSGGFRSVFNGTVDISGNAMSGTGTNDPMSPGGNAATYAWTAQRAP